MATIQKYLHLAGLDVGWQGYTAGSLGRTMGVAVEPPPPASPSQADAA